jgi:putative membrane protein
MKQLKLKIIQGTFALLMMSTAIACNETPKVEDSKEIAETHNEAKFENSTVEKDAQFLVNAAEINLQEIQLANLAQLKSTNADVKDLAKTIGDAHTKSMADLKGLAMTKNITIPVIATEDATKAYDNLSAKNASDFNKEFCDMMVAGHKDAIAVFEKASNESMDVDIKNWATTMLTELRMHADKAIICQTKINAIK